MGFGGSVQGMITSIKNNRALLRRKKIFESGNRNEKYKYKYGEVKHLKFDKTATKAQLEQIRTQAKLEQRSKLVKVIVIVALFFVLVLFGIHLGINEYKRQQMLKEEALLEQEAQIRKLDYTLKVEQAEHYFQKNEWLNASIAFREANKLKPLRLEHQLLLAKSMFYNCKQNKVDCFTCIDLVEELLAKHPNNPALLAMQQDLNSGF